MNYQTITVIRRNIFLYTCFVTISLVLFSCKFEQNDNKSKAELDSTKKRTIEKLNINKVDLIENKNETDTSLFNPFYKPFYGGLTMAKIFKLYKNDNTASGPGNPLKIKCYQNYTDSATGTYHYFDRLNYTDRADCHVNVSIWKKGFYDGDTNQRINSIFIESENFKFNKILPFTVGQRLDDIIDTIVLIDSNIYRYEEKDYKFLLFTQNKVIRTVYIKRFYCEKESLSENEIAWFKSFSKQSIRRNKKQISSLLNTI